MGTTQIKAGVTLTGLQPAGLRILAAVDNAARLLDLPLTITCGTEAHPPGDPHTRGVAVDVRARDLTPSLTLKVYHYLTSQLGAMFTVLYECPTRPSEPTLQPIAYVNPRADAPHFHVQLKRSEASWPPGVVA